MSNDRTEMTSQELDNLASAHLDGESTAEETALVSSNLHWQTQVEQLRTVKTWMTTPVEPPSDEVQDRMIAQALAQRTPVTTLEDARRRRLTPKRAGVALAAAAVVAAIAIVSMEIVRKNDRPNDDSFATMDSASEETAFQGSSSSIIPEDNEIEEKLAEDVDTFGMESNESLTAAPEFGDTAMDDGDFANQTAMDEESHPSGQENPNGGTASASGTSCLALPEKETKLFARFITPVAGTETEVSVYIDNDLLLLTRTTPLPTCRILGPVLKIPLSSSP